MKMLALFLLLMFSPVLGFSDDDPKENVNFIGTNLSGEKIYLSDYVNKNLIVFLWDSSDRYSNAILEMLAHIKKGKYGSSIEVVAVHESVGLCVGSRIDCGNKVQRGVDDFLSKNDIGNIFDKRSIVFNKFRVRVTPTLVFINESGQTVKKLSGEAIYRSVRAGKPLEFLKRVIAEVEGMVAKKHAGS
ncbi:hypothetical protein [Biformimicrobium ophioploci]|uniref:Thioredoxin domain-containing protein n=1 Tax=Biformimicrobium ophioploci TaxID=3036711 RepID=A0ABQ6LZD1_9GAMM|nr:hypothetical protein [Microbulbifer sp. NKW57]GMG87449.1 hypothetical protein MNKW57_17700 [Microbulbifer sp. NKW57]